LISGRKLTVPPHLARLCPLVLALAGIGCEVKDATTDASPASTNSLQPAPAENADARGVGDSRPEPAVTPKTLTADPSIQTTSAVSDATGQAPPGVVDLIPVKYEEMLARIAANKKAKLTLVDAWATWCGPCKENFPHVVEMHQKYADKGLAVVSLSLDDREEPNKVEEAKKFLRESKAVFTNFLLDEDFGAGIGFEKLKVSGIPAVFLYGPDGKEVRRFTVDDPDNQFTYDQVEQDVVALLAGKPVPQSPPGGVKVEVAKPSEK